MNVGQSSLGCERRNDFLHMETSSWKIIVIAAIHVSRDYLQRQRKSPGMPSKQTEGNRRGDDVPMKFTIEIVFVAGNNVAMERSVRQRRINRLNTYEINCRPQFKRPFQFNSFSSVFDVSH